MLFEYVSKITDMAITPCESKQDNWEFSNIVMLPIIHVRPCGEEMKNEKLLILGDSISTFSGYNPDGYSVYYPIYGEGLVSNVSQCWWYMLAKETESQIVLNNSWSGSTVCNTGYDGDCSHSSSFIYRLSQLRDNGFFDKNEIDRVLVLGGTNDYWTGNTFGEVIFDNWTEEDLKSILPGVSYFFNLLVNTVPKEKVHAILNEDIGEALKGKMVEICEHYDVSYTVLTNIDKIDGHPTYKGMTQIKNQVLSDINAKA